MKILYLIDKPNMYGSERHLLGILNYFHKNNDISLISFDTGDMLNNIPKIDNKIFYLSWFIDLHTFIKLYKHIKNEKPAVIHCHQPKALFIGTIIGFLLGMPTIITIHSRAYDHALVHKNIFKKNAVYVFHKIVGTISLMLSRHCIYVNKDMYSDSIAKKKSIYISNWLDPNFKFNAPKVLNDNSCIRFISIGSFTKAKGFDILIEFFEYLAQKKISFQSDIYGNVQGNLYGELEERVRNLKCVNFKGFKDNLEAEYRESDIYILFSRSETFGLTYLEAMSQGLPIIALDLIDLKDLVPYGNVCENNFDHIYDKFLKLVEPNNYNFISKKNIEISKSYSYLDKMMELDVTYKNV